MPVCFKTRQRAFFTLFHALCTGGPDHCPAGQRRIHFSGNASDPHEPGSANLRAGAADPLGCSLQPDR